MQWIRSILIFRSHFEDPISLSLKIKTRTDRKQYETDRKQYETDRKQSDINVT